jgi:MerR family transcriptional regulator/heat shock protein HspR
VSPRGRRAKTPVPVPAEVADLGGARAQGADRETPLYMISVVAELLGVHPQTLRLYEREGYVRPQRTRGGTRLYSEADVDTVRRILHLTRDLGVNLAGVEVVIEMRRKLERMQAELAEALEFVRREMKREVELQRSRTALVRVSPRATVRRPHERAGGGHDGG